MNELFLKIINMSLSAGWLILAVLLVRFVFQKVPRWIHVLLWGIVAFRLICPFSIKSTLSLIPNAEMINPAVLSETPADNTWIPTSNHVVTPPTENVHAINVLFQILSIIWLMGVLLLCTYTVVSYWQLYRRVAAAVPYRDNIFQSEQVNSPFVLGILRPRIYLPFKLDSPDLEHVVAHEQAHIRRKDYLWKPLGFLLLAIHWFNPLMWLAYILLCRDIEFACDEKVIKELDNEQRADYTQALVACSVDRRMITACPLTFGEVDVKERVKSVKNYKKTSLWILLLAGIACVAVAVCFLTDPVQNDPSGHEEAAYYLVIGTDGVKSVEITNANSSGGVVNADGSLFTRGEKVWLEPLQGITDLRGMSITALSADGEILYALSIPESASDTEIINLISSDGWLLAPAAFESNVLTLNDVITLSKKGAALSWADFEEYSYIETGSGLYIRVYKINETFELWIGGGSPDRDPMYIYLALSGDIDTKIDIRDGGVAEFIDEHS